MYRSFRFTNLVTRSASELTSRPLAIGGKSNWATKVSQLAHSPTGHLKERNRLKGGADGARGYSPKYCLASHQGALLSVGDNVARHWRPVEWNLELVKMQTRFQGYSVNSCEEDRPEQPPPTTNSCLSSSLSSPPEESASSCNKSSKSDWLLDSRSYVRLFRLTWQVPASHILHDDDSMALLHSVHLAFIGSNTGGRQWLFSVPYECMNTVDMKYRATSLEILVPGALWWCSRGLNCELSAHFQENFSAFTEICTEFG